MSDQSTESKPGIATKSIAFATTGMIGLAGRLGDDPGTLATQVTDQSGDIADVESCGVHIVGGWLGPEDPDAGDEETDPSGQERYEFDGARLADLVELQDGNIQLIDVRELEPAAYTFRQLDIDEIDATRTGGETATVEVPAGAPLTFNEPFAIREGTRTGVTADVTPVRRGATESYVLQPVADGIVGSSDEVNNS